MFAHLKQFGAQITSRFRKRENGSLSTHTFTIPTIIHQTWKTTEIPYDIYDQRWVESWTQFQPQWLNVLWTDERLRSFGRACYPEYEIMYQRNVPGIYLADFGRYMVLHHFGGLYVDLDYECLRNIEPLLAGFEFVTSYVSDSEPELNNALIASVRAHPLLKLYMDACQARWTAAVADNAVERLGPGVISGPDMMTEITSAYLSTGGRGIQVYDTRLLCPIDWRKGLSIDEGTLTPEIIARVTKDYPDAYAATYWTHVRL